jgi:hypothetical protein
MDTNGQHQDVRDLTPRQQAALPHLASNPTMAAGVEAAAIGRTTLTRWMNDDKFRIELTRMRQDASDLAFAELQALMLEGMEVLAESMRGDHQPTRLSATKIAINSGIRANDSRLLRKRLDIIEDGLSNLKAQR